jgi:hypothetical protein
MLNGRLADYIVRVFAFNFGLIDGTFDVQHRFGFSINRDSNLRAERASEDATTWLEVHLTVG